MKILILGGTRYAGVHLVNALLSRGHKVTIANRGITPDCFGDRVTRKIIERHNKDSLHAAFHNEHYDVVIDNLAYCSNDVRCLLDSVHTEKYVMTSTVSVYNNFHMDIQEAELDAKKTPLKWCNSDDYTYDEVKRQAEAALFQKYEKVPSVTVRFPWIFGADDYTKRLFFYAEHIFNGSGMHVNNLDARLAFVHSKEAGDFLAWCAENPIFGAINACSHGTTSPAEIIAYAEKSIGKKASPDKNGAPAPLNDVPSFSLDTTTAQGWGYCFQPINEWLYPTIDYWAHMLRMK
ncbi:MAG: NAD-dependent epimerase/dehydratase family protein [Defluviitaleaceae bacterium]|nr:NAD-dependent epimerase/dehydratase family protein [Defluviitaleaceae bacterium]MCL2274844.1 NAD-dependent epimerase/dehydratase family protein [Defluviitaleaceae bacterium]